MAKAKVKKMAFGGRAGGPPNLPMEGRARDLGIGRPEGAPTAGRFDPAMLEMAKNRGIPPGATMLRSPAGGPPNLPMEGRARDLGLTRPEGAPSQGAVNQEMLAMARNRGIPAGATNIERPSGMKKGGKACGMKKGGKVRGCGIAERGLTKGKMR